eukprot:8082877-Alexandrium_andersonii.AAC.1
MASRACRAAGQSRMGTAPPLAVGVDARILPLTCAWLPEFSSMSVIQALTISVTVVKWNPAK